MRTPILLILAGLTLMGEQITAPYVSPGPLHKVQVNNPELTRASVARGSKIIADYGSFQLLEVGREEYERLTTKGSSAMPRDEYNLVSFLGTRVDTSVEPARPPLAGRSLHVIQFRGPIRSEWPRALEASGVKLISPLAQNAYLVLGTEDRLSSAASVPMVQWSSPYVAAYKMDPRLNGGARGTNPVTLQLLQDDEWNGSTLALVKMLAEGGKTQISTALGYVNVVATIETTGLGLVVDRPDVISVRPYAIPKRRQ